MLHQINLIIVSGTMFILAACSSTKFNDAGAAHESRSSMATTLNSTLPSVTDAECENGPAVNNPYPDVTSPISPMDITLGGTDIQNTDDGNLLYTFTLKNELSQASSFRAEMGCMSGSGVIATAWSFTQDQMRDVATGNSIFADRPVITLGPNESRIYQIKVFGVRPLDVHYNPCWIVSHTWDQQDGAKCVGTVR